MKVDLAIFAVYAALLLLTDPSNAVQYTVVSALLGAGVTWLVQSKSFHRSFAWFRTHRLEALAVALLTSLFLLMPFALLPLFFGHASLPLSELPKVLTTCPIAFMWFWAFSAAGARLKERRINELVERRLAEIRMAERQEGDKRDD